MAELEARCQPPAISVIMPAYNQARYLAGAIQSVLEQSYSNFELIIVDDGSTDETPEVLARAQDPRIRVIRQPNRGLPAARNAGLRECSAPLVTFLDADDCFRADKLEILSTYLKLHPEVGLVAGTAEFVDPSGRLVAQAEATPPQLTLDELLFGNPICVSGILVRRQWLERVGVFDETLRACEDWDLWLRLSAAGCPMAWVGHPVVAYRIHPGQMTRDSDRMRQAILAVLNKFFAQTALPAYLADFKNQALAAGLVHAAGYAYHSGKFDRGGSDLTEALRLDPGLQWAHYKRLVALLVGWSNDPQSTNPAEYLERVVAHPPHGHPDLARPLRSAIADALLAPLFRSSSQAWRARRRDLLLVIRYKPAWLLNRGVLRMVAAALLPT